jgi:heptosyltransferase-3
MKSIVPKRIIISRTDSIGDVVLTLPICAAIKKQFPDCKVLFMAARYTVPVVERCPYVDEVVNWTELSSFPLLERLSRMRKLNADTIVHVFPNKEIAGLAKKAKIQNRVGTSHRSFHLLNCNYRPAFTRKKSNKHEAQLNFKLLDPFGMKVPSFEELKGLALLNTDHEKREKRVLLHPKSQGSAVEWPIDRYSNLANALVKQGHFVYVTGTAKEGETFQKAFNWSKNLVDTSGKFSLSELLRFISASSALVACSTGPLHLAGATGVPAFGLFSPRRPIHPGRWKALGERSVALTSRNACPCKKDQCECINLIEVKDVLTAINRVL